jgi:hypothetical protein
MTRHGLAFDFDLDFLLISISSLARRDLSQDAPLDWSLFFGAGLRIEKIVKKLVFFWC